ncbi:undecaprenyldiphospho-muramoylpentapeptide beta-N-acetylglucosaminyltransferase [Gimibacter soli]|uniref:UDP-N-acetylglucosamine--N-acetylmuramyl-(pentapeptide) pyrophosphoryl-undecaprenol N-acetylglucosamine transferase n=1 Tax=Gimibacter soli TaxID=3024400 RepID=A0AAE9XSE6_9PROT|nr:undecaprenyldiphospho-muramoylpentapeptide beta-N-acetylglucosaminyltransferase [Gimibacter soli]WCL55451.1 undecaprenyldiphospho-muramoylpentapeptide beta-N-acetylglucosaminyltransferase [Gimibacter soli]
MSVPLHILLAAGGTGGHMVPAEALAAELTARGHRVSLVTDARGDAFKTIMAGIDRFVLQATSHMQGGIVGKLKAGISLVGSFFAVRRHFRAVQPDVIVGFGGYPSMPAVMGAKSLGLPYILHEQNAVLGRVNRWTAKGAAVVALTTAATERVPTGARTAVTGNPVRPAVREAAKTAYAVPEEGGPVRLFILGGSQGAHILSKTVPGALAMLDDATRSRLQVQHQARPADGPMVTALYATAGITAKVEAYFENVPEILASTHLVISRAGASTLAELTAVGRPAILVPLAIAADDHQRANAAPLVAAGGAIAVAEKDFTPDHLAAMVRDLLKEPARLSAMAASMKSAAQGDAGKALADLVLAQLSPRQEQIA